MSETWTPVTAESETWTRASAAPTGLRVFSPLVFSHATHNSLHVFAFGNASSDVEAWYNAATDTESWTAA